MLISWFDIDIVIPCWSCKELTMSNQQFFSPFPEHKKYSIDYNYEHTCRLLLSMWIETDVSQRQFVVWLDSISTRKRIPMMCSRWANGPRASTVKSMQELWENDQDILPIHFPPSADNWIDLRNSSLCLCKHTSLH